MPAILPKPSRLEVGTGVLRLGPATSISAPGAARSAGLLAPRAPRAAERPRAAAGRGGGDDPARARPGRRATVARATGSRSTRSGRSSSPGDARRAAARGADPPPARRPAVHAPRPPGEPLVLPAVEIEDAPRFAWRGGHLDVARHCFPAPSSPLRRPAGDAQAERAAPPPQRRPGVAVPLAAATRSSPRSAAGAGAPASGHARDEGPGEPVYDGTPHGGFYRLRGLRELVAYATERNVTVVPEIDLPGHAQAAIAAYPWLGSAPGPLEVWPRWGVSERVLDLAPGRWSSAASCGARCWRSSPHRTCTSGATSARGPSGDEPGGGGADRRARARRARCPPELVHRPGQLPRCSRRAGAPSAGTRSSRGASCRAGRR